MIFSHPYSGSIFCSQFRLDCLWHYLWLLVVWTYAVLPEELFDLFNIECLDLGLLGYIALDHDVDELPIDVALLLVLSDESNARVAPDVLDVQVIFISLGGTLPNPGFDERQTVQSSPGAGTELGTS